MGFVEYIVVAQHRESWQTPGALLDSKAELSTFALELSKRMGMRYRSPAMPVDLTLKEGALRSISELQRPDSIANRQRSTSASLDEERVLVDYSEVAGLFDA